MADPIRRARQSVCTVPSEPFGGKPSALCDAGGDPAAPPHEPGVPGQLRTQVPTRRYPDRPQAAEKLQEKRMALGHKLDDHEEQWPDMTM